MGWKHFGLSMSSARVHLMYFGKLHLGIWSIGSPDVLVFHERKT